MIHANHMLGLAGQRFAERALRELVCGCSPPAEQRAYTHGWD